MLGGGKDWGLGRSKGRRKENTRKSRSLEKSIIGGQEAEITIFCRQRDTAKVIFLLSETKGYFFGNVSLLVKCWDFPDA